MGAARGIGIAAWGIPGGRSAIGLRCQVSSAFLGSSRLGLGAWLDHGEDLGRSTGPARGTPAEIDRLPDRLASPGRGLAREGRRMGASLSAMRTGDCGSARRRQQAGNTARQKRRNNPPSFACPVVRQRLTHGCGYGRG